MPDEKCLSQPSMKLDCLIDSRNLLQNSNSRISTLACSDKILASGTFEGGYILQDISIPDRPKLLGEYSLTNNSDGITNYILINKDKELIVCSNDKYLRYIDLQDNKSDLHRLPFAINCIAINAFNENELFITGDHINSFLLDKRIPITNSFSNNALSYKGHKDYGFSCDWSPTNENYMITGNQDGSVKLWDKRKQHESIYSWNGSLGSPSNKSNPHIPGGPIRNSKFSCNGDFICWAESLDHVGILEVNDLMKTDSSVLQLRVQSIDFIGKCIGLNFAPEGFGNGEHLVIGINDCPLGGILSYKLESKSKSLDYDFRF